MRQAIRNPVYVYLLLITLVGVSAAALSAREPPEGKKDKAEKENEKEPNVDEEWHKEAEKILNGIELEMLVGENWAKVKRTEKPLLYYSEPTRNHDRGSVWAWGEKGRPVALAKLCQQVGVRSRWKISITNTSGGKLRASRDNARWWLENESAVEFKGILDAPAPATDEQQRQRQLKQMALKFTGHEFWDPDNSRYELRRLERPLHTYKDENGGTQVGALYTLANGTNPEIMLFIEARVDPKNGTKATWQFLVGRLAHAELHLEYDGKEVFTAPRANRLSGPEKPYWLSFIYLNNEP
ncbi:hypothetical protein [Fimbriiglobus ruber]|uniref:Uncharacterized protein n=1 Tax=Fimbriiglobus ruber TaxID=1908690 RepID=A0A225D9R4_9BACT|nr:hypothetical protein [Fimbriiglobus ruber]OWK38350.1 hypothetical protein FRUB_07470 [Fimbriiglobus ruber]